MYSQEDFELIETASVIVPTTWLGDVRVPVDWESQRSGSYYAEKSYGIIEAEAFYCSTEETSDHKIPAEDGGCREAEDDEIWYSICGSGRRGLPVTELRQGGSAYLRWGLVSPPATRSNRSR